MFVLNSLESSYSEKSLKIDVSDDSCQSQKSNFYEDYSKPVHMHFDPTDGVICEPFYNLGTGYFVTTHIKASFF